MNHLADITEIRRSNLQKWIDAKFKGRQAGFVALTDINQGDLSALLKNKSFGEKKARNIEEKAGMPKMWLDTPHAKIPTMEFNPIKDDKIFFDLLDVTALTGKDYYSDDFPETVQKVVFKLDWAKKNIGSNLRNIHLITAKGDSMEPTIKGGDILFVDSAVQFYNGEGIYVIVDDNGLKVKRLQSRTGSGGMNIISDNSRYKIEELNREEWQHVRVLGRVVYGLVGKGF